MVLFFKYCSPSALHSRIRLKTWNRFCILPSQKTKAVQKIPAFAVTVSQSTKIFIYQCKCTDNIRQAQVLLYLYADANEQSPHLPCSNASHFVNLSCVQAVSLQHHWFSVSGVRDYKVLCAEITLIMKLPRSVQFYSFQNPKLMHRSSIHAFLLITESLWRRLVLS